MFGERRNKTIFRVNRASCGKRADQLGGENLVSQGHQLDLGPQRRKGRFTADISPSACIHDIGEMLKIGKTVPVKDDLGARGL